MWWPGNLWTVKGGQVLVFSTDTAPQWILWKRSKAEQSLQASRDGHSSWSSMSQTLLRGVKFHSRTHIGELPRLRVTFGFRASKILAKLNLMGKCIFWNVKCRSRLYTTFDGGTVKPYQCATLQDCSLLRSMENLFTDWLLLRPEKNTCVSGDPTEWPLTVDKLFNFALFCSILVNSVTTTDVFQNSGFHSIFGK